MTQHREKDYDLQLWHLACVILISLCGIVGNTLVLIVYARSKNVSKSSPFNVYLCVLGCVDLVISLFIVPDYVLRTNIYKMPDNLTGTLVFKFLTGGIAFWMLGVSLYLLVAICLERRRVILTPFSTLEKIAVRKTLLVVFCVFILGALGQVPTWYGIYYNEKNATAGNFCSYSGSKELSLGFHIASFIVEYTVPLLVILISFIQIKRRLIKMEQDMKHALGIDAATFKTKWKQLTDRSKTTIKTMTVVVVAFFVCITPNQIAYLLFQFVPELPMNSFPFQVTVLLRFSNSCLNPLLYSYRSQHFRKNFVEVFGCSCDFATARWVRMKRWWHSGRNTNPLLVNLLDDSD